MTPQPVSPGFAIMLGIVLVVVFILLVVILGLLDRR